MRFSGTIFMVSLLFFTLLCLAWFMNPDSGSDVEGVADMQGLDEAPDRIEQILSGEYKRTPKKNPALGNGRLRGYVRNEDASFVAGATIQITPVDRDADILKTRLPIAHYWESSTDSAGRFSFQELETGSYVVSASTPGFHAVGVADVEDPGVFAEIRLVLSENITRRGLIQDEAGIALEGARVIPLTAPDWMGDARAYRYVTVTTNERGAFVHPLLPRGAWDVLVVADGYAPTRITLSDSDQTTVQLGSGQDLQGRAIDEGKSRPLNNVRVMATAMDEAAETHVSRTNGQGFFSFRGLRPARYAVRLDNDRYLASGEIEVAQSRVNKSAASSPESRDFQIDPVSGEVRAPSRPEPESKVSVENDLGEGAVLTLTAVAATSIRGRVLESSADFGVPDVRMEAFSGDSKQPVAWAKTDQAGYYQLKGLAPGSYRIVSPGSRQQAVYAEGNPMVHVEMGERVSGPVFRVASGERLWGSVTDSHGKGVADANVFLGRSVYPGAPGGTVTGQDGTFELSGIHQDEQVTLWGRYMDRESEIFGPVTVGAGGLQGILLRVQTPDVATKAMSAPD